MTETVNGVVELKITPLDQYYYVSQESGDTFTTKPYIMHTALYYALGFLPTRFRVAEQTPSYEDHFCRSALTDGLYLHPARLLGGGTYETRRFSVKGDTYRTEPVAENKNLLETGHQRTLSPGAVFRTFALCRHETEPEEVAEQIDSYIRVGKKMTTAHVQTAVHEVEIQEGHFELQQPVARTDLNSSQYQFLGNLRTETMAPVNLIIRSELDGEHVQVEPVFNRTTDETLALPTQGQFLGITA